MTALQILVNGILLGGTYVLIAQSLNLIFGVMKVVNLAQGGFIVMAGLFTFWAANHLGMIPLVSLPIVLVAGIVIGGVLEPILIEPLMGQGRRAELLSLMVTFGLNYVMTEIALNLFGTSHFSVPYLQNTLHVGGVVISSALLVTSVFAIVITLFLYLGLKYTFLGKSLLAASQSATGALSCGINVRRVRLIAFAVGVGLASASGALFIMVRSMAASSSDDLTILAFVIIALGGLGSYRGAVIAAFLLGIAQSIAGYFVGGSLESVLPFILLLLVMLLRPKGFQASA